MSSPRDSLGRMSEHADHVESEPVAGESVHTGVPAVDAVVEAVAALGDRPLSEHVEVFEAAHRDLRSALDSPAAPHDPA